MAATKNSVTLIFPSGGGTTSGTTTPINISADYLHTVCVRIVQVGTATTPAQFTPQWSPDGITYYSGQTYTAPTTPSGATPYDQTIDIPAAMQGFQIAYVAQAG